MEKVLCHKNNFEKRLTEVSEWNVNTKTAQEVQAFFKDYSLGKITGKRGINPERNLERVLYFLKIGLENITGFSAKDCENFLDRLLKNEIRAYNKKTKQYSGDSYAAKSKKAILKTLSRFLSWKLESPEEACKILDIEIQTKKHEIETLNDTEVEKLLTTKIPIEKQYLLRVLNASGLRAEEFHNIRDSDITLPQENQTYVKIRVRNDFTKTIGRTITLYDKECTPLVREFLRLRREEGMRPEDPVYDLGYNGSRKWMNRLGKKVLGRRIYYHLWRHTAATRLASKLNRQQLCIYFGWKFNSPMPDIYIERSGVNMQDVEETFVKTDMEAMQHKFDSMEKNHDALLQENTKMKNDMKLINEMVMRLKDRLLEH